MQLPLGLAQIGRNLRYTAQSVGCRYGLSTRLQFAANNRIAGLGAIRFLSPADTNQEIIQLLGYTQADGNVWSVVPFQQDTLTKLTTPAFLAEANLALVPGANPTIAQAANMGILGMTNLVVGVAPGLIYDPEQGTIDQISDIPFGAAWQPNTPYRIGQVVTPSQLQTYGIVDNPGTWVPVQTGFLYQCIAGGGVIAGITIYRTQLGFVGPYFYVLQVKMTAPWSYPSGTYVSFSGLTTEVALNGQTLLSVGFNPAWNIGGADPDSAYFLYGAAASAYAPDTGYAKTSGGTSGPADAQPAWPAAYGGQVTDASVFWQECTPIALTGLPDPAAPSAPTTAADGASPITPGATVYLACTMVNEQGEGINELVAPTGNNSGQLDPARMLVWTNNTPGPVDLTVTLPAIAAIFGIDGPLGAQFGATKLNLYALIVQGTPDPAQIIDPTFYGQVAGGPFTPGTNVTISAYPTGQQLPAVNTAVLNLTPGNVPTGVRYMLELFETRTDYQTGWTVSTPVRINVTQSGQQITLLRSALGPYNIEARIFAFTVAGASAAGPYAYVDQADFESPGFNQPNVSISATRVPDNTTVTTAFNITDTYLPGASDVTAYGNRIQIPPFVDAYYSKTLLRVVYSGAQGYPSTLLLSDTEDPQGIEVPGSNLDIALNDGDRVICYREVRNIGIAFKENSGFSINSNDGTPNTWAPEELWRGMGPVGAKAIDVSAEDNSQFAVFAHRSGLYLYEGGAPKLISRELYQFWNQINWDYGALIVVRIDQQRRQVRISVPLGDATQCSTTFTMDYFFGVGDPVVFITRRGVLVPNPDGRKWSVDDIAASDIVYVPQRSAAEAQQAGVDIADEMIFACADGSLKTVTDAQYYDEDFNGAQVGYFGGWIGVPGPNPGLAVYGLVGATCSAIGNGLINVYAVDDKFPVTGRQYALSGPQRPWRLQAEETQRDFGASAGHEAARWGIGFDNGAVAGAWWEMHTATLYNIKKWSQRPG